MQNMYVRFHVLTHANHSGVIIYKKLLQFFTIRPCVHNDVSAQIPLNALPWTVICMTKINEW